MDFYSLDYEEERIPKHPYLTGRMPRREGKRGRQLSSGGVSYSQAPRFLREILFLSSS